jgi:sporulation protein YlmC with PRC-barrel domain
MSKAEILEEENLTGVNREGAHPNKPLRFLTAKSIIGDKVHNDKGEHMGVIEDIMVDIPNGRIEYVIIKFGGFLTINEKYFAIPFNRLKVDEANKAFILNDTREILEKAPGFDLNHWPETNLHAEKEYWNFVTAP